jgi:hypothetical protein
METTEQSIINRIQVARGTAEPAAAEPTEEPSVVDVSAEAEPEEVETAPEEVVESAASAESEEEESQELASTTEADDSEDFYVDFKGREISFKDIEEWEQGSLRQSDYTRKTTELSEQRKALEAEKETFAKLQAKTQEQAATLEALIEGETVSAEDLAEMREYDPDAYIKYQEKQERIKSAISGNKSATPAQLTDAEIKEESTALWSANPSWMEDGKQTQAFQDDMNLVGEYAKKHGFSDEEISGIQHARHWQLLLDAARASTKSDTNAALVKKVRKAPVSTRPKAVISTGLVEKIKKAEARLKQTGKTEDAVKLRQLKRQVQ